MVQDQCDGDRKGFHAYKGSNGLSVDQQQKVQITTEALPSQ